LPFAFAFYPITPPDFLSLLPFTLSTCLIAHFLCVLPCHPE
jgi:hypothetical protein